MQYVCGFYMNFAMDQFLLIKKAAPEWMAGKWNGVGGKINGDRFLYDPTTITKEQIQDLETTGKVLVLGNSAPPAITRICESPYQAMCREFGEETDITTREYEWHCFHIKQFANDVKVYYFAAFGDKYKHAKSMTKEEVRVFDSLDLHGWSSEEFIYDVPYLVQMIRAEMRNNNFITLNPEGINDDKYRTKAEDFGSTV